MSDRKIRLLIAKPGLDERDRGAKTVAVCLSESSVDAEDLGRP